MHRCMRRERNSAKEGGTEFGRKMWKEERSKRALGGWWKVNSRKGDFQLPPQRFSFFQSLCARGTLEWIRDRGGQGKEEEEAWMSRKEMRRVYKCMSVISHLMVCNKKKCILGMRVWNDKNVKTFYQPQWFFCHR